jgi:uncharacterized RDD family membrane protein YckC
MQPHESTELEYVGFWARTGAALIDSILVSIVALPLLTAIYGAAYSESTGTVMGPADIVIKWVLPAAFVLVLWIKLSATPGKMAIRAIIVDARTGGKPTTRQFIIRYVGYYIASIPLLLGILWVGFDARKQGWHDKMAGTVVVRRKGGATQPVKFDATDRA